MGRCWRCWGEGGRGQCEKGERVEGKGETRRRVDGEWGKVNEGGAMARACVAGGFEGNDQGDGKSGGPRADVSLRRGVRFVCGEVTFAG